MYFEFEVIMKNDVALWQHNNRCSFLKLSQDTRNCKHTGSFDSLDSTEHLNVLDLCFLLGNVSFLKAVVDIISTENIKNASAQQQRQKQLTE